MQGKSRSYGRVALAALGAASVTAALFATAGTASAAEADYVPAAQPWPGGGFVVSLKDGEVTASAASIKSASAALAETYGGRLDTVFTASMQGFLVWDVTHKEARKLAADPKVAKVFQNGTASAADVQENATWGIDRIDQRDLPLDDTYTYNATASNVTVYVTDTGIRPNLGDFEGRASIGPDFVDDGQDGVDCHGHGTHVAGTVGSKTYGVAKKVKLVAVRTLGCSASAPDSASVEAIEWITQNGVKPSVVNASWTFGNASIGDEAIAGMLDSGIQLVAASGNSGSSACNTGPAKIPEIITVNATSSNDARSGFSNYGTCTDLFAPGSSIESLGLNGSRTTMSGTSMASPHVAGVAALYLSENTGASPQALRDAIVNGATDGKVSNPGSGSPNKLLYSLITDGGEPEPPTCEGGTNGDNVSIPDNNTAITSTVSVSDCSGNATGSTTVDVDINHTYTADLKVELVGPSGTAYLLHAPAGIGESGGIHETFTVDASDEAKSGTWKLRVTDIYRHDTGTIDSWTLGF